MIIVGTRPSLFATGPANQAPTAQPISAEETANPFSPAPSSNCPARASTAPLITAVSNPNRKPPSAAAVMMLNARAVRRLIAGLSTTSDSFQGTYELRRDEHLR